MLLAYLAIVLLLIAIVYSAIVSFRQKSEPAEPTWTFPAPAARKTRVVLCFVTLICVTIIGAWFALSVQHTVRRSSRFLIPEGYTGWVRIEFEVQGAPPLPVDAGQYVVAIGPDGSLKTSSLEQYGWANDSYYFYSSAGMRSIPNAGPDCLIWGKINGEAAGSSGRRKYEGFFVGTEREFKNQGKGEKNSGP
jgi:hypothetical protein